MPLLAAAYRVRTRRKDEPLRRFGLPLLPEQPQHVLVGLRGQRQRGGRQLLAGLQGEQVGALLVAVGEREVVGAGIAAY